jgi:hypothetical protein
VANKWFPKGLEGFAGGDVAWDTDTIKVVGVSAAYVYDAAHDFLADVAGGARLQTSAALGTKTLLNGVLDAADISLLSVVSGSTLTQLLVFQDTGVEATSRLLIHYDTKGDGNPISVLTNGGNIDIVWNPAGLATL